MASLADFEQRLLLFIATTTAHNARCLHKAGLLDRDARKSLEAHFRDLAEDALALDEPGVQAVVDLLQRTLPPPLP